MENREQKGNKSLLIAILAIIAVGVIILFASSMNNNESQQSSNETGENIVNDGNENTATNNNELNQDGTNDTSDNSQILENTDDNQEKTNLEEEENAINEEDINNEDGQQQGAVGTIQKADASYERWLAAAMVTAISLHYPDFQINGIYLTAETELSSASESSGAYVAFTSGEESLMICSKPLEEERTEAGTIDLYTMDLGFATFDEVDVETVNTEGMLSVEAAELSELISQSMLVSLYER